MSAPPRAAAEAAPPLDPAGFARRLEALGPFEARPRLAVAVSGGPDSLALALLAQAWAEARGGAVLALVVDHGLRPESAAEAAQAARWLAARGVSARALTWRGAKPAAGLQATAREARRALLEEACREEGILHLLLAHHADDQAETVALRARRGSGPLGRAGMAAVVEGCGLRVLRPLLGAGKAQLLATLRALGQPWIEDPTNRDPRFARAALRQDAAFRPEGWWEEGRRQAARRAELDAALAAFFARAARPHPLGQVALDRAAWGSLRPELRAAALGRAIQAVRGGGYPPPAASLDRLAAGLAQATGAARATLGGCAVEARGGALVVAREPGRVTDERRLEPGGSARWDNRFVLRHPGGGGALTVRALGEAGRHTLPAGLREALRRSGAVAATVAALPALWDGAELVDCPPLRLWGWRGRGEPVAAAILRGSTPLAGAPFLGTNVVSNPQRPIYPAAGVERVTGTVGAAPA